MGVSRPHIFRDLKYKEKQGQKLSKTNYHGYFKSQN